MDIFSSAWHKAGDVISDVGESIGDVATDVYQHPFEGAAAIALLAYGNPQAAASFLAAGEQKKAGEQAKDVAARAASMENMRTAELIRVAEEENRRVESIARTRAAASGLGGASTELYISALTQSGREDIDWIKTVGASSYQARLDEGQAAFNQARAAMWGSIGGATGALQSGTNRSSPAIKL